MTSRKGPGNIPACNRCVYGPCTSTVHYTWSVIVHLYTFSVGVRGHALFPSSEEEAYQGVGLRWSESEINGQVGSPNAFPWPSIDCVVDRGEELRRLLESEATAFVTEKLDGSNLCLHSNGVVASRRIVIANNTSLEDFKSLRYIAFLIRVGQASSI